MHKPLRKTEQIVIRLPKSLKQLIEITAMRKITSVSQLLIESFLKSPILDETNLRSELTKILQVEQSSNDTSDKYQQQ